LADAAEAAFDRDGCFFELDFVDAAGERQREPLTTGWNVAFETVEPVRRFRWAKGTKALPGLVVVGDHESARGL
jgi:hypothetical protein